MKKLRKVDESRLCACEICKETEICHLKRGRWICYGCSSEVSNPRITQEVKVTEEPEDNLVIETVQARTDFSASSVKGGLVFSAKAGEEFSVVVASDNTFGFFIQGKNVFEIPFTKVKRLAPYNRSCDFDVFYNPSIRIKDRIYHVRDKMQYEHARLDYMTDEQLSTRINRITDPEKMVRFIRAMKEYNKPSWLIKQAQKRLRAL